MCWLDSSGSGFVVITAMNVGIRTNQGVLLPSWATVSFLVGLCSMDSESELENPYSNNTLWQQRRNTIKREDEDIVWASGWTSRRSAAAVPCGPHTLTATAPCFWPYTSSSPIMGLWLQFAIHLITTPQTSIPLVSRLPPAVLPQFGKINNSTADRVKGQPLLLFLILLFHYRERKLCM
jgi:hypothetical protein